MNRNRSSRNDKRASGADSHPDESFKVIIIGQAGVGKTSLLVRFVHNTFDDRVSRAVSTEKKTVKVNDGKLVLNIQDTEDQESSRLQSTHFYQGTDAVIIVYDVTSEDSFYDMKSWAGEVHTYLQKNFENGMPVLIVGNKKDLLKHHTDRKVVRSWQVDDFAKENEFMGPLECSAKTGENVERVFQTLASKLASRSLEHGKPKLRTQKGCCPCSIL